MWLCFVCFILYDIREQPEEIFEEDYYSVVVQTEEDIYQDLCYIDRQSQKVLFAIYIIVFMLSTAL